MKKEPINKRRIPKSQWLTALLAIYLVCMAGYFGPQLVRQGEVIRLIVVSAAEIIVLILLYIFLRKRERNR